MNNSYLDYLKAMQKSDNTIRSYLTHINEMLSIVGKNENDITYVDLLNWQKNISNTEDKNPQSKLKESDKEALILKLQNLN